jgi:hypothetical protein
MFLGDKTFSMNEKSKGKGKIRPRTGHEGLEGE